MWRELFPQPSGPFPLTRIEIETGKIIRNGIVFLMKRLKKHSFNYLIHLLRIHLKTVRIFLRGDEF